MYTPSFAVAIRLTGTVCMALWLTVGCATMETSSTSAAPVVPRVEDASQAAIDALADGDYAAVFWSRVDGRVVLYPIDSATLRAHAHRGSRPPSADMGRISNAAAAKVDGGLVAQPKGWSLRSVEAVDVTDRADGRRYWLYLSTWQFAGPDVPDIRIPVFPDGVVPTAILHEQPEGVRL